MLRDAVTTFYGSDIDLAFEDEVGGAGEGDSGETVVAGFLEADHKGVAAFDIDLDGAGCAGEKVVDQCGSDHTSATSERLIFDAALEGANRDMVRREHGGEVGIGASRGEGRVVADGAAVGDDIEGVEGLGITDEGDDVRHPGVEEVERGIEAGDFGVEDELEVLGIGHGDADVVADHRRAEGADGGLEGDFFQDDLAEVGDEAAEATRTIAAHFSLAAVGIVITEAEIRALLGGFHGEQAVGADAAVAITQRGDGVAVEFLGEREVAVVNDDEVVAGTVHFEELEKHLEEVES